MVYSYMNVLKYMNPGTITRVEIDEEHKFKYLFFALGASIEGFRAMRKVIIMDGTHLKNIHGGILIVATAQDPDHHHYPIAFGIADGEKDASWGWFLKMLKSVVPDSSQLVFLTDRHQSIIKCVAEVYPLAQHGYCMWHLAQNVKGSVHYVNKETVGKKFMECTRAYTEAEFVKLYTSFRMRYPSAAAYLDKSVEVEKWARCYFPGERYNILTTNSAESMNGIFKDAREYSLLPMLDAIISKMSEWFNKYRQISAEVPPAQKLVPYVNKILHERCKDAKKLMVSELNSYLLEYNVIGFDGKTYLVDLDRKTCSCKCFDIDRYPCVHALAANRKVKNGKIPLHDLCSKYYWVEQWALAYSRTIFPVPHHAQWKVPDEIREMYALPPSYVKKQGRNQTVRYPSVGERGRGRRGRKPSNIGESSSETAPSSSQRGDGSSQGEGGSSHRGGGSSHRGRGSSQRGGGMFSWFRGVMVNNYMLVLLFVFISMLYFR